MDFYEVVTVDLDGRQLGRETTFDAALARTMFGSHCLRVSGGLGAAAYLRCNGVVVDQVVSRPVETAQSELVFGGPDAA